MFLDQQYSKVVLLGHITFQGYSYYQQLYLPWGLLVRRLNASSIERETYSNRVSWPTGEWNDIKKNEMAFVGLIANSYYRPQTSGPLFSVPMSISMTRLPDVQSAEKCWKITASCSQDYSCPARSDIVTCKTPSNTIIKKPLHGRVTEKRCIHRIGHNWQ